MLRTKRRKVSDGGEGDTLSIDRLSDLPDSILCHILSFLPTKTSVRTSVLARRWRFVWKFVPNLYFYFQKQDIINRVLLLHQLPSINTLRLDSCRGYQMETWIIAAVARNVRNLDITHHKFQLPLRLFTCQTLVDLSLNSCCIIPLANTVWLPCLKKLNLSLVQFEADESLPRLLSGCPVLEYLLLELLMEGPDLVTCNISSPTVKRLDVRLNNTYAPRHRLKIDTPALEYLKLFDCSSEHIESGMMTSLTEANIELFNFRDKGGDFVYSQSVLQLLNSLCNVKRLRLNLRHSKKIIDCVATVSFHNLTELELNADSLFLSKFMENADNLEILIFHEVCGRAQVPTCVSSNLRFLEMHIDEWSDFEIVRYLLRNALILESIKISHSPFFMDKNRSIQEISQIERGSKACELEFCVAFCRFY